MTSQISPAPGVAVKALAGAGVNDAGDVVGLAWREFRAESSGPADGEDQVNRTAVFDGGEGSCGGVLAGSGAGGDPFLFRHLRWAQR